LRSHLQIEKIEPVIEVTPFSTKDPLFSDQWYLDNQGYSVREEITDVRSILRKGVPGQDLGWLSAREHWRRPFKKQVSVAVLDVGVDYEHEELKHAILLNEVECDDGKIPLGAAKEDRDGNGYPGDWESISLRLCP
jgi:hypothetical protein